MQPWLRWTILLLAAGAGFVAGFDFGRTIGGSLAAVLLGLNAAAFAALLVSGAGDLWRRLRR
jgi:hypothetical protein